MKTSESIKAIVPALISAQKKIKFAVKDSENPFFKSKYAGLPNVIEACKDILNDNGIVALQPIQGDFVETTLIHTSGEFISSETKIICSKQNDPQAYGSAITYARRYGLQSFVLMPAEDDDGEGAMDRNKESESDKFFKAGLDKIAKAKTVEDVFKVEAYFKDNEKFSESERNEIHKKATAKIDELNK